MVTLHTVVRILGRVVKRGGYEPLDRRPQRWGPIRDNLNWFTMGAERCREEPSRGSEIPSG